MMRANRAPRSPVRRRIGAALSAASVAALTVVAPAAATGGGGHLGGDGDLEVGITVTTPGFDQPVDLDDDTRTPPVVWTVVDAGPARPGDLSGLCLTSAGGFGWRFWLIGRSPDGTILGERLICRPFDDPASPPPAPEPPVLPTIEAIWRHARLPVPVVGIDPPERGITGLETRIWVRSNTELALTVALDGYSVTARAVVVGYTARVDSGPVTRSDHPGGPDAPVLRHGFEVKGPHRVEIGAVWRGTATFAGPGLSAPVTTSIGEAVIRVARTYPVREVRALLRP